MILMDSPIDLTSEILEEKGLTYDEKGFEEAQKEQRAKSEGTFGTHNYSGKDASVYDELDAELSSEFVGYDQLEVESDVIAMTSETEVVDALTDGDKGYDHRCQDSILCNNGWTGSR